MTTLWKKSNKDYDPVMFIVIFNVNLFIHVISAWTYIDQLILSWKLVAFEISSFFAGTFLSETILDPK